MRLLLSVCIFTFIFVIYSFAQEQVAKEAIEKAMQQATTAELPEEVQQKIADITAQEGSGERVGPKDMNLVEIEGMVNKIAEDSSYIVVGETTLITNSDFLTYNPVKVGDRVVVMVALTGKGMEAIGVNLAGEGKEEVSEEFERQDAEGVELGDYIPEDIQKDDSPKESPIEEMPSDDMPEQDME